MTHDLWATLNEKIISYLASVKFTDLVAQQSAGEQNANAVAVLDDGRPLGSGVDKKVVSA